MQHIAVRYVNHRVRVEYRAGEAPCGISSGVRTTRLQQWFDLRMYQVRFRVHLENALGQVCFSFVPRPMHTVPVSGRATAVVARGSSDQVSHIHIKVVRLANKKRVRPIPVKHVTTCL